MSYLKNNSSNFDGSINSPSWQQALKLRTYRSTTDTAAQIAASGYFNDALADHDMEIGDVWITVGSDLDVDFLEVTAISPDVTTISAIGSASIPDGSITTPKLADLAVTTAKIADNAVTSAKIPDQAVITAKLDNLAVTNAKLAVDAVMTTNITDGAIDAEKIKTYVTTDSTPGIMMQHVLNIPGGAGTTDAKTFENVGMTVTAIGINWKTIGTTSDTVKVTNAADVDITEAFDTDIAAGSHRFFTEVDLAFYTVASGNQLKVVTVDGGGSDSPNLEITFYGFAIA